MLHRHSVPLEYVEWYREVSLRAAEGKEVTDLIPPLAVLYPPSFSSATAREAIDEIDRLFRDSEFPHWDRRYLDWLRAKFERALGIPPPTWPDPDACWYWIC